MADAAFRNWTELRDAGVVRQRRDFSCGLASLATLLHHYFGLPVTEDALLDRLLARDGRRTANDEMREHGVSLADLAWLAGSFGVASAGLELPLESLLELDRPVIAYLEQDGLSHFAVLRGAQEHAGALLADPAAGNRRVSLRQLRRWFALAPRGLGRILVFRPPGHVTPDPGYFGFEARDALLEPRAVVR